MRKRGKIYSVIVALGMAAVLAGCAATQKESGQQSSSQEDSSLQSLTIASQINMHSLPTYIAKVNNVFEENGLEVSQLFFSDGSTENEALGNGEWDIGTMGNLPSIAGGVAYNSHVIAIITNEECLNACWVRPDSDIAKVTGAVEGHPNILGDAETWRGKTVLVPTATASQYTLIRALELMGLTQDDINVVSMSAAQCLTAFQAGQGDAIVVWPPVGLQAEDAGFVKAFNDQDTGTVSAGFIVASEDALQNKRDEVLAAVRSIFKTVDQHYGTAEEQSEYYHEMSIEGGAETAADSAIRVCKVVPPFTLQDNVDFFEGEIGERKIDGVLDGVFEFCIAQGMYTQEELDNLKASGFLDSSIIEALAAE